MVVVVVAVAAVVAVVTVMFAVIGSKYCGSINRVRPESFRLITK